MSISLDQREWLESFLDVLFENYNPEVAAARADQLEGENRGVAAINASLEARGVNFGLPHLDPSLSAVDKFPYIKFLSTLKHQCEIVLDVGIALDRQWEEYYGRLAIMMVLSAFLNDLDRMENLADIWRDVLTGEMPIDDVEEKLFDHYAPLSAQLNERALLKSDPLLALPVNQGISYFDIRLSGMLALALYDDERLHRHEAERLLFEALNDRIHFVEATIALAWSNGLLESEERNLIKKQIEQLRLEKKQARKLITQMITPRAPKEFAHAFSSPETSQFVFRQMILASMIDGTQDHRERKFLFQTSKEFGLNEEEYNEAQEKIVNFMEENREAIERMKGQRRVRPKGL